MGIKSIIISIREFIRHNTANLILFGQFTLIALIFFGLGIVYAENFIKEPPEVTITEPPANSAPVPAPVSTTPNTEAKQVQTKNLMAQAMPALVESFVASKNGTAYYLTTCRNNIKEENRVYFQSKEDAEKAGFRPAKNCFK